MWPDGFPRPTSTHTQIFMGTVGSQALGLRDWCAFQKKPGVSWYFILAVGGGGGGARPNSGNVTAAGGGGGSGALSRLLIPAMILPDTIYIHPGRGGQRQTTVNTLGNNGLASWVTITPLDSPTAQTAILRANGGGGGLVPGAGSAGVAATATDAMFQNYGIPAWIAGQAGSAGSAAANGAATAVTPFASIPVSGGAGGGNGTAAGGNVNAVTGLSPAVNGGVGTTGGPGLGGIVSQALLNWGPKSGPLFSTGGSGGGGVATAATAGAGGNGGYGSGGGGGGSGTNAGSVSGNGGAGGPGFVIIMGF